jgi:hypothetical protein
MAGFKVAAEVMEDDFGDASASKVLQLSVPSK